MKSQRRWGALFQANLRSDEEFAKTMQEIRRVQGEMDKFEEYGLDAGTIEALRRDYASAAVPGELPPARIETIRRKSRNIDYADAAVRSYGRKYLSREQKEAAQQDYARFRFIDVEIEEAL